MSATHTHTYNKQYGILPGTSGVQISAAWSIIQSTFFFSIGQDPNAPENINQVSLGSYTPWQDYKVINRSACSRYAPGFPGCPAPLRSASLSKSITCTRHPVAKATSRPQRDTATRKHGVFAAGAALPGRVRRHLPVSSPHTWARKDAARQ